MPGLWSRAFPWLDGLEAGLIVAIAIVPHVVHGAAISLPEALAELLSHALLDGWVLVHFMVIGIGMPMFADVVAGRFDAFMEAATLGITVFRRGLIPTVVIVILVEGRGGNGLSFMCGGFEGAGRSDTESNYGRGNPF